jgi:hypothetical protein
MIFIAAGAVAAQPSLPSGFFGALLKPGRSSSDQRRHPETKPQQPLPVVNIYGGSGDSDKEKQRIDSSLTKRVRFFFFFFFFWWLQ